MDEEGDAEIDRRDHQERRPPADALDQELGEGNAEGAGEPAEEGHHQDALPETRAVDPGDHREGRLIEDHRLAGADAEPQRVEHRQRIDLRPHDEHSCRHDRSGGHQLAAMAAVDPVADRDRAEAGHQQPGRQRAEQLVARPAEFLLHRHDEQRKRVVDEAPRDELAHRQDPENGRRALAPRYEFGPVAPVHDRSVVRQQRQNQHRHRRSLSMKGRHA